MTKSDNEPAKTIVPKNIADVAITSGGQISTLDAFGALTQLMNVAREAFQIHEIESTKREKLRTYRETEVKRIKTSEKILSEYFDRVFDERTETHKRLFDSLDVALNSGDHAALQTVVDGIVEVAQASPLANLGNLAELRRAMDDPNTIFEF